MEIYFRMDGNIFQDGLKNISGLMEIYFRTDGNIFQDGWKYSSGWMEIYFRMDGNIVLDGLKYISGGRSWNAFGRVVDGGGERGRAGFNSSC